MPLKQEVGGSKPSGPVFTLTKVLAMMKAHCDDCGKQCFRNVAQKPLELTRGKTTIKMEVVGVTDDGDEIISPAANARNLHEAGAFDNQMIIAEIVHNRAGTRAFVRRFEAVAS